MPIRSGDDILDRTVNISLDVLHLLYGVRHERLLLLNRLLLLPSGGELVVAQPQLLGTDLSRLSAK
jgi:hypothetical protein